MRPSLFTITQPNKYLPLYKLDRNCLHVIANPSTGVDSGRAPACVTV